MNINWPVTTLNAARIEYVRIRSTNPPFSRTFSLTNFVNYFRTSEARLRKFSCKLSSATRKKSGGDRKIINVNDAILDGEVWRRTPYESTGE